MNTMPEPELTRSFPSDPAPKGRRSVVATPEECARIAARLDEVAVADLQAEIGFAGQRDGAVLVTGTLQATVTRRCSATSETFDHTVSVPVETLFVTAPPEEPQNDDDGDGDGLDWELLGDRGEIEIGELLVQLLSVSLPQFPRKPGAPELGWVDEPLPDDRQLPFAGLADKLRR